MAYKILTALLLLLFSMAGLGLPEDKDKTPGTSYFHRKQSLERISVNNNQFIVNGHSIWINGVNTPWNSWNEFGRSFDLNWWLNHFKTLHENSVNCVNVWIFCDGNNPSPVIDQNGLISSPTHEFWADLDKLFEIARTNRIYLMITLITFNHSRHVSPNHEVWQKMYANPINRESFVTEFVIPLLKRFRDNPYFFSIKIGDELEWAWENHNVLKDDVLDLIARVANAVHENSNVLVCNGLGSGPKYNSHRFRGNLFSDESLGKSREGAYLDFYNIHYYDWQDNWFGSPFNNSPRDWSMAEKPCLIGEYPAKGTSSYTPLQCLQKAFYHGWQGVMVWTSNGVDANGNLIHFKDAFSIFRATHDKLVFPLMTVNTF